MTQDPPKINLILVPGIQGTGLFFDPLLAHLPPDLSCVVIAYPDNILTSLEQHADYVAQKLPAGGAFVLAESFGGLVTLMLLHRHYEKIKGVIFSATFSKALYPWLIRGLSLIPGVERLVRRLPVWFLNHFLFGPYAGKDLLSLLKKGLPVIDPAGFKQRAMLVSEGYPYPDDYFSIPCLYIQAMRDRIVPSQSVDWFASHFSPFERITLDAPHSLLQTRAQECADKIVEFVRQNR